jgi:hypothetical protein
MKRAFSLAITAGVLFRSYKPSYGETTDGSVQYFDLSLGLKARL